MENFQDAPLTILSNQVMGISVLQYLRSWLKHGFPSSVLDYTKASLPSPEGETRFFNIMKLFGGECHDFLVAEVVLRDIKKAKGLIH